MYCVNDNKDAKAYFAAFFFNFPSVTPISNTYGHFSSKFSQKLLDLGLSNL